MHWKKYENEIFERFQVDYPSAQIFMNVSIPGRYSKRKRQIDILIEDTIAGNKFSIVVDGKYFNKKVDVKSMESFISMLHDVNAHKGLLISQKGFTKAAINRANNDPSDIEFDILNFDELKTFQGELAIPHIQNYGVLLIAPFGWIIDGTDYGSGSPPASLHQRGLDLNQAINSWEFMYVQFWDRKKENHSLEDLIKKQEKDLKKHNKKIKWEYSNPIKRTDAKTILRKAGALAYPGPEYTGFVEFEDFIFFCVLHTKEEFVKKNLRKLINILETVRPIKFE